MLASLSWLLAAAVCFLAPASAPGDDALAPVGADALWAWSWDAPEELVQAVRENGFSRVYLYCEGGFDGKTRRAIAALGAEGVAVEALGGESRWATTQRPGMLRFVRGARSYQRNAPASARLAGIHFDIEPYGLPSWDRNPEAVGRALVASLATAQRRAGDLPVPAAEDPSPRP